jgi:hypothetical protein
MLFGFQYSRVHGPVSRGRGRLAPLGVSAGDLGGVSYSGEGGEWRR